MYAILVTTTKEGNKMTNIHNIKATNILKARELCKRTTQTAQTLMVSLRVLASNPLVVVAY
jgi:hypothetical protein